MKHIIKLKKKSCRLGEIKINDYSLMNRGIVCASRPIVSTPLRQQDFYTIGGFNGYKLVDHEGFGEREVIVKLSVKASDELKREEQRIFLKSFLGKNVQLELYNYPFGYFEGTVLEFINLVEEKSIGYNFTVEMKVKLQPFQWMNIEKTRFPMAKGDSISFNGTVIGLTLLIQGSGTYSVIVGNKTYNFTNVPQGTLSLDLYHYQTKIQNNDGSIYKTSYGYTPYESEQVITWSGNISSVTADVKVGVA